MAEARFRPRCGRVAAVRERAAAALAIAAAVAGCAAGPSGEATPAWIDRPPAGAQAPDEWTAVGTGESRQEAEDAALTRLAQRVEARVQASETLVDDGRVESLERVATIRTDVRLLGARIRATHRAAEGTVHALAALNATEAASRAREQAAALVERAEDELDAPSPSWLHRLRARRATLDAAALLRQARAMRPSGRSDDELVRRTVALAQGCVRPAPETSIQAPPDAPAAVVAAVGEAVRPFDLAAVGAGVVLGWRADRAASFGPDAALRWTAEIGVEGGGGGVPVATFSGVALARTPAEARAVAARRAAARIGDELARRLDALLERPAPVGAAD